MKACVEIIAKLPYHTVRRASRRLTRANILDNDQSADGIHFLIRSSTSFRSFEPPLPEKKKKLAFVTRKQFSYLITSFSKRWAGAFFDRLFQCTDFAARRRSHEKYCPAIAF